MGWIGYPRKLWVLALGMMITVFWINATTYIFFLVLIWVTLPNVKMSKDMKPVNEPSGDGLVEKGLLGGRGAPISSLLWLYGLLDWLCAVVNQAPTTTNSQVTT